MFPSFKENKSLLVTQCDYVQGDSFFFIFYALSCHSGNITLSTTTKLSEHQCNNSPASATLKKA